MDTTTKGQTLIEVVAALGIAIAVISAITIIVISSLSNTQFSKNQHAATQYAQEGIEQIRLIRDTDRALFDTYSGSYCLDKGSSVPLEKDLAIPVGCASMGSTVNQNVDIFAREIIIEKDASACAYENPPAPTPPIYTGSGTKVTVTVSWRDSKCTGSDFCHVVQNVSCFSDFGIVPTPGVNP